MWPDRVSNPGPLTYKSGALPIALRGPATATEPSMLFSFIPFMYFKGLTFRFFWFKHFCSGVDV